MKLLFCDNSLKELVNFRGDVIEHFLDKGYEIVLVAPDNQGDFRFRDRVKLYTPAVSRSGMNPMKDMRYLITLLKIYSRERPSVVFHYTIKPNIYGSLACRLNSIKSVAMITGLGYTFNHDDIRSRVARVLSRFAMRFPEKIMVLNQSNLDVLVERHIVLPHKAVLLKGGEGLNLDHYK